ncbi:MAG: AAA family ATPase, partial [Phycisphaeraceae bacterium]|nr:AAA family ATPase [Phycisphaeraceae bacterium]
NLDLPVRRSDDHGRMLERLREKLIEQLRAGTPIVLLVDEAQTRRDDALDELRLLSNMDTATDKLVQIVLVGQPELRERIRTARQAALRQRIVLA